MKFLLDNNVSHKLVGALQPSFPGTMHVREALSVLADDIAIWKYARAHDCIILTKDNDFDDRSQLEGCPPKIVHLICGNKSTQFILGLILSVQNEIEIFAEDDDNCILKIR